jgi:hypothetical protein
MRYMVRVSYVDVIGKIWMPSTTCAQRKTLRAYDVENIRACGNGRITRRAVEQWLCTNTGDFSSIEDFRYSIEDGKKTRDSDWAHGDTSDCTYSDCMYPAEE